VQWTPWSSKWTLLTILLDLSLHKDFSFGRQLCGYVGGVIVSMAAVIVAAILISCHELQEEVLKDNVVLLLKQLFANSSLNYFTFLLLS
jgi:hypothetical protein